MFFLFSGEGITDLGSGKLELGINHGENYFPGPMAVIADHVIERKETVAGKPDCPPRIEHATIRRPLRDPALRRVPPADTDERHD
jgi:hypothetical protein